MKYGFLRVACGCPEVTVGNCEKNVDSIIDLLFKAEENNISFVVFPELSITGYTCGDLFLQQTLLDASVKELLRLAKETSNLNILFAVGVPLAKGNKLYNCATFILKGKIVAVVPKTYIPNHGGFCESRYFSSSTNIQRDSIFISSDFSQVPFGTDIILQDKTNPNFTISAEISEDLWVPSSPSVKYAQAGANIIANLSANNEVVGKAQRRDLFVSCQSAKLICAYLYAEAGKGESTTDFVFSGHCLVAENGKVLNQSKLFEEGLTCAEIDLDLLIHERRRCETFASNFDATENFRFIEINLLEKENSAEEKLLWRNIQMNPFVPTDPQKRSQRCQEVFQLQVQGLAKRLRHTGIKSAVIGLSGGLDSALALLVTEAAFKVCSLSVKGITAVTMPCFGTTNRTKNNAIKMANILGTNFLEIPIQKAINQHFLDIGHDESIQDVTYENSQARERTQILMDLANKTGGLVIGTGDLSELALGWATYNGDHMSMYGVNASVPKTLVRHIVSWYSEESKKQGMELSEVLESILATPVSPELLPPTQGNISQKTEELVGPYELHDFFLYNTLRFGFSPAKVYFLAKQVFIGEYSEEVILKWLKKFYFRFFSQQFKRSCMPDGGKVGSISLSPRGDWKMPSDASCAMWQRELDNLK